MIENIILDVDGTLWDATAPVAKAWNAVYERRGLSRRFSVSEAASCMGLTIDEIKERYFSGMSEAEREEIMSDCLGTQNALLEKEGGRLYPGVRETLEALSGKFGLYIVSNCECGYIEALLSSSSLGRFFKGFLCAGETGKGKGDNLLILMKEHALENCVYVGDTLRDELACRKAGIPFIWASYGFGKAERPTAVVRSFPELKSIVESLGAE